MTIIKNLLKERGIQCEEAGGSLAPGQSAFCQKICSKIITSQFCIVLLNHDEEKGQLVPNANVNMEYGLMLGFNKYLIPFQLKEQSLPFNVSALDTVKYGKENFESEASKAIEIAIEKTKQGQASLTPPNQLIELFLLSKKALYSAVDNEGEKNIFRLGSPFGFNLLNDFSGMTYIFFGNFTALRPEMIIWRLHMLNDLLNERRASLPERIDLRLFTAEQIKMADTLFSKMKIWLLVTSDEEKAIILSETKDVEFSYRLEVFSQNDIRRILGMGSEDDS
ncbi:MAG TPA: hypothetical protein VJ024_10535 [Thermodesulfovibrionales bacterium]|nr:hypothetical protein [Thermodesulfovibrionales bacterium]